MLSRVSEARRARTGVLAGVIVWRLIPSLSQRQIAFPDLIGLPEARYLLGSISTLYSPELVVGLTPGASLRSTSSDRVPEVDAARSVLQ